MVTPAAAARSADRATHPSDAGTSACPSSASRAACPSSAAGGLVNRAAPKPSPRATTTAAPVISQCFCNLISILIRRAAGSVFRTRRTSGQEAHRDESRWRAAAGRSRPVGDQVLGGRSGPSGRSRRTPGVCVAGRGWAKADVAASPVMAAGVAAWGAWQQPLAQAGPQSEQALSGAPSATATATLCGCSSEQAWLSNAGMAKTSVSRRALTKPVRRTISRKVFMGAP